MSRPRKDYKPLSIKIAADVHERMCEYCEETGQSKTIAVERGLTRIMDEHDEIKRVIEKARVQ